MVAVKTWVPNELLKSADLNGAFATVAQGYMPGALCEAGANTAVTAGVMTEIKPLAPLAGNDQGGYWDAATSRLIVPVGLGGLYLLFAVVKVFAPSPPATNLIRVQFNATGGYEMTVPGPLAGTAVITIIHPCADGKVIYVNAASEAAGNLGIMKLSAIRLATLGLYS